jgi:hypothetical protein
MTLVMKERLWRFGGMMLRRLNVLGGNIFPKQFYPSQIRNGMACD